MLGILHIATELFQSALLPPRMQQIDPGEESLDNAGGFVEAKFHGERQRLPKVICRSIELGG